MTSAIEDRSNPLRRKCMNGTDKVFTVADGMGAE